MGKKVAPPVWWKNTFFWFAGLLALVGLVGVVRGDNIIRDPGQIREGFLWAIYLGSALLMLVNGWLTHKANVRAFEEEYGPIEHFKTEPSPETTQPDAEPEPE